MFSQNMRSKRVKTHKPDAGLGHGVRRKRLPAYDQSNKVLYPWLRQYHVTLWFQSSLLQKGELTRTVTWEAPAMILSQYHVAKVTVGGEEEAEFRQTGYRMCHAQISWLKTHFTDGAKMAKEIFTMADALAALIRHASDGPLQTVC